MCVWRVMGWCVCVCVEGEGVVCVWRVRGRCVCVWRVRGRCVCSVLGELTVAPQSA